MKAFALISLKECNEKELIDKLTKIPEIEEAHILFGEWDILIKINIENPEALGTFMIEKIRSLPEVKFTSTLIVAK